NVALAPGRPVRLHFPYALGLLAYHPALRLYLRRREAARHALRDVDAPGHLRARLDWRHYLFHSARCAARRLPQLPQSGSLKIHFLPDLRQCTAATLSTVRKACGARVDELRLLWHKTSRISHGPGESYKEVECDATRHRILGRK